MLAAARRAIAGPAVAASGSCGRSRPLQQRPDGSSGPAAPSTDRIVSVAQLQRSCVIPPSTRLSPTGPRMGWPGAGAGAGRRRWTARCRSQRRRPDRTGGGCARYRPIGCLIGSPRTRPDTVCGGWTAADGHQAGLGVRGAGNGGWRRWCCGATRGARRRTRRAGFARVAEALGQESGGACRSVVQQWGTSAIEGGSRYRAGRRAEQRPGSATVGIGVPVGGYRKRYRSTAGAGRYPCRMCRNHHAARWPMERR